MCINNFIKSEDLVDGRVQKATFEAFDDKRPRLFKPRRIAIDLMDEIDIAHVILDDQDTPPF